MIFCCENCRFLFVRDRYEKQCPDCGKLTVRAANQQDRAEYKRIQLANARDHWFLPRPYQVS